MKLEFSNSDEYKRAVCILALFSSVLAILLLCLGFLLSNESIGSRMALLVSPDGYITPVGHEMLKVAGERLRFLGILMLSCSFLLFGIILFLPSLLTKFFRSSIRRKFVDCVFGIRWDVVLGIIGITYLCLMLIIGVMFSPFSNDESLRINGAKQFTTSGSTFPLDVVGSPIDVSKGMSLPPYLPAILCVTLGGGHASPKALYAVFCLFCIIVLGYATYKTFGKRAIGFTVFFASMLPFVHQYAVDAARTEMLATLVLLIGVVLLYQRTYKSRWIQILACFAIGLSFQFKITLIVFIPVFVITGLISGTSKEWRSRVLAIIVGPVIAIAAFWILDLMVKAFLLGGGRDTFHWFFSYWFTSSMHGTLASKGGVSFIWKLSAINRIIVLPIFTSIIIISGFLLIKEKCNNPLRLFVFLAAIGWIAWWLIFDPYGIFGQLLVGFLFFSVLIGGFSSEVFGQLVKFRKAAFLKKSSSLWPSTHVSLAVIMIIGFVVFGITSVAQDLFWLEWAMPMRKGQEQLAEIVAANKEEIIFCYWGHESAYEISALSGVPFWDISQGLPPDSVFHNKSLQLIVSAWMKRIFKSQLRRDLPQAEKELIDSKCILIRSIGGNDVYEVDIGRNTNLFLKK